MLVSHKHRFIFVKTRKTGGTSVELALAPHCGPDDIITPLKEYGSETAGISPRNYRLPQTRWSLRARAISRSTTRLPPARAVAATCTALRSLWPNSLPTP